jgi:hypothetical protein
MEDLKSGFLNPILTRVQNDHTLMLAIREDYINIYYRGGNLLQLTKAGGIRHYIPEFDENYIRQENATLKTWLTANVLPLATVDAAKQWVDKFAELKQEMDLSMARTSKDEREFQQLIFRENNFSRLSNKTEYFFTDIEYASPINVDKNTSPLQGLSGKKNSFRFDMLGVEWLSEDRNHKSARLCRPVIVEVKYGDNSLTEKKSGMTKHFKDMQKFLVNCRQELVDTVNYQLSQLQALKLIKIANTNMQLQASIEQRPIILFVIANANPRSSALRREIAELESILGNEDPGFDVRFFVSNFAGYAMHASTLLDIAAFSGLIKNGYLLKG